MYPLFQEIFYNKKFKYIGLILKYHCHYILLPSIVKKITQQPVSISLFSKMPGQKMFHRSYLREEGQKFSIGLQQEGLAEVRLISGIVGSREFSEEGGIALVSQQPLFGQFEFIKSREEQLWETRTCQGHSGKFSGLKCLLTYKMEKYTSCSFQHVKGCFLSNCSNDVTITHPEYSVFQ